MSWLKEGTCLEVLERKIHDDWHFIQLMTSFVDERKNAKFQILKKKDGILNVEELTTIIKVDTNLFLNEDDVNLYALKAIPKPQEKDMPSIMTLNEEVDVEKAIFLISLKDLTCKRKREHPKLIS
jgi:hypothetical protein